MKAGKETPQGMQCFALYGQYSNAKLLYSYGFTLENNPFNGVDFWLKVPQSDPNFHYKQSLLQANPLTANQDYNFTGTLHGDGVSIALMATLRIIHLATQEEFNNASKAFSGKVSPRNEAAAVSSLVGILKRKLTNYRTSMEEDEEALRQLSSPAESGESLTVGENRSRMALMVRLSDKKTIQETIEYLEKQLTILLPAAAS
mmetsp:Transcript_40965/g.52769  ORF Transcript_40965/g.52769 Transcript_40965/m.52769 type:complete len:202 (+) Transcript_40965:86-691(+)